MRANVLSRCLGFFGLGSSAEEVGLGAAAEAGGGGGGETWEEGGGTTAEVVLRSAGAAGGVARERQEVEEKGTRWVKGVDAREARRAVDGTRDQLGAE